MSTNDSVTELLESVVDKELQNMGSQGSLVDDYKKGPTVGYETAVYAHKVLTNSARIVRRLKYGEFI